MDWRGPWLPSRGRTSAAVGVARHSSRLPGEPARPVRRAGRAGHCLPRSRPGGSTGGRVHGAKSVVVCLHPRPGSGRAPDTSSHSALLCDVYRQDGRQVWFTGDQHPVCALLRLSPRVWGLRRQGDLPTRWHAGLAAARDGTGFPEAALGAGRPSSSPASCSPRSACPSRTRRGSSTTSGTRSTRRSTDDTWTDRLAWSAIVPAGALSRGWTEHSRQEGR